MIITKLIKIANCDNVSYGFPVIEINYKNIDKEIITINSLNKQTACQAEAPEQGPPPPPPPNGLTIKRHNQTVIIVNLHVISN